MSCVQFICSIQHWLSIPAHVGKCVIEISFLPQCFFVDMCRWRCAVVPSKTEKRTLLHDLYEQQKQSPWYDNLRRPVTILEPLIKSGVRGVTSNPTVCHT
jgi:hypothetical protein